MADFCAQCAHPYPSDFAGIPWDDGAEPLAWDMGYPVICEGCGPTLVDHEGNCMGGCRGEYSTHLAHFRTPPSRQLAAGAAANPDTQTEGEDDGTA